MHIATIWQVTLASDPSFASPVATVLTTVYLTSIPAITGLLPLTNYLARARYIDDDGKVSPFGVATPFTTLATNTIPEPGTFAPGTQGCADC